MECSNPEDQTSFSPERERGRNTDRRGASPKSSEEIQKQRIFLKTQQKAKKKMEISLFASQWAVGALVAYQVLVGTVVEEVLVRNRVRQI